MGIFTSGTATAVGTQVPRRAYINQPTHPTHKAFCDNSMKTAKYVFLSVHWVLGVVPVPYHNFFPKFVVSYVFTKMPYLYFLLISALQISTDLSPTGKYTTIAPLVAMICISMIREGLEDRKRHADDRRVNNRPAKVETSNLDGETSLKIRKAADASRSLQTAEQLSSVDGLLEQPNNRLYTFEGTLTMAGTAPVPIDANDTLFSAFDTMSEAMGVYKVQTIGDAYIAVTGMVQPHRDERDERDADESAIPTVRRQKNDAVALASFALAMLEEIAKVEVPNESCAPLNMRIGLHVGRVVAGVVGTKKFRYDIWGKDVMTATLMESHGVPGEVCVSESLLKYLDGAFEFKKNPLHEIVELPHAKAADGHQEAGTIGSYQLVRRTADGALAPPIATSRAASTP